MNETVREWLDKANGDLRTARREFDTKEAPTYDAVCYHCQQSVEKAMKAVLIHNAVAPPYVHDLLCLDELLRETCPSWTCDVEDLRLLTHGGIAFRYPGESATRDHASQALDACIRLRDLLDKFVET